jgi:hypothetical protein
MKLICWVSQRNGMLNLSKLWRYKQEQNEICYCHCYIILVWGRQRPSDMRKWERILQFVRQPDRPQFYAVRKDGLVVLILLSAQLRTGDSPYISLLTYSGDSLYSSLLTYLGDSPYSSLLTYLGDSPQCHFVYHKSHVTWPGLEPDSPQ